MADAALVVTDANFEAEVLQATTPVLVNCWAPWCTPCHRMTPTIDWLAQAFAGRATVASLNVNNHTDLAIDLGIQSIPTLLFFHNGAVIDQAVGLLSRKELADMLTSILDGVVHD